MLLPFLTQLGQLCCLAVCSSVMVSESDAFTRAPRLLLAKWADSILFNSILRLT